MGFKLTDNQQLIFDHIERSEENVLVMGKPGCGKSVLINHLAEHGDKNYTFSAPTGLAALNIGGRTLHSLFRLPTSGGVLQDDFNNFVSDEKVRGQIRRMKHLICDEVSMVRADMLDFMDRQLREIRSSMLPFGGLQMILVGDFFQLPPVVTRMEEVDMNATYRSPFVFSSRSFKGFKTLALSEVLRQKDPVFLSLLDRARTGEVTGDDLGVLNRLVSSPDDMRIRLVGTNRQADEINQRFLAQLADPTVRFVSQQFGYWPALPAEELLTLRVGAQVMVKYNGADLQPGSKGPSKVVNGTLGRVTSINERDQTVEIEMEDGQVCNIYRRRWERKIQVREDGGYKEKVEASFDQMPLALAWAVSIHKSQGQSFDKCHVDTSKIFQSGQTYVALSRCRSLEGLSLEVPVTEKMFWANPAVVEFEKMNQVTI